MANIRTRFIVATGGRVSLAELVPAGEYVADMKSLEALPGEPTRQEPTDWPTFPFLDAMPVNPDATFSREEIYGDDMR